MQNEKLYKSSLSYIAVPPCLDFYFHQFLGYLKNDSKYCKGVKITLSYSKKNAHRQLSCYLYTLKGHTTWRFLM